MWFFYALLSAFFAALVAIFSKMGLKNVDSTLATTIRSLIMAVFLILASLSLRKFTGINLGQFTGKDWWLIILAGIAGALSWLFYFYALKQGLATNVAVIDRLSLVFVAVLAATFLGEAVGWKAVLGIILIVSGSILVVLR